MSRERTAKSLKDRYRWQLWLTIVVNVLLFYGLAQWDLLTASGIKGLWGGAANLVPVGLALVITSVANGLLSAEGKAKLVFLRWRHALPGHRAFSVYAGSDPRIDLRRLKQLLGGKVPTGPQDENRAWYKMFKEVESETPVLHVHREFLFTRDYTGLIFLFILILGPAGFVVAPWHAAVVYLILLLLQFFLVRQAAANYGRRFVCTVLAHKAAKPARAPRTGTQ